MRLLRFAAPCSAAFVTSFTLASAQDVKITPDTASRTIVISGEPPISERIQGTSHRVNSNKIRIGQGLVIPAS